MFVRKANAVPCAKVLKPSRLISWGRRRAVLKFLFGRHGAISPAGKVRCDRSIESFVLASVGFQVESADKMNRNLFAPNDADRNSRTCFAARGARRNDGRRDVGRD